MKQAAQLACGVAWASFFPGAVSAGAAGDPSYFILAAAAAMLPGFVDRALRGLVRHDIEIVPDPADPDPRATAEALAGAIDSAAADVRQLSVRLHPVKVGTDAWLCQEVFFDTRLRAVTVTPGPVVDGSNAPLGAPAQFPGPGRCGFRPRLTLGGRARLNVRSRDDIVIRAEPAPDGSVTIRAGHRLWGRNATLAAAVTAVLALAAIAGPLAGAVAGGALALGAILEMKSAAPAGRHSIFSVRPDSTAQCMAVAWISCVLVMWNLDAGRAPRAARLRAARIAAAAASVPPAGILVLRRLSAGSRRRKAGPHG